MLTLGFVIAFITRLCAEIIEETSKVSISSSCNDKRDGVHYIKPTSDGNVIPVICNHGYTMLDVSLNYDEISKYFTSIYQYGDDSQEVYGTDCGDSGGWRDWYIPANENTKFRVAVNCLECKKGDMYGDNTAYYMTNGYFCPTNQDGDGCESSKQLEMDFDVMCNVCDDTKAICGESNGYSGQAIKDKTIEPSWCDCYSLQLTADSKTTDLHKQYCQFDLDWRAAFVKDRSQCTCYKPSDKESTTYKVSLDELPIVSSEFKSEIKDSLQLYVDDLIIWDDEVDADTEEIDCDTNTIYLSQSDFLKGTYRIEECGTYVLTEDIVIHFNKPDVEFSYENGDSPNSPYMENLYWNPTNEQQESGKYFGLNAYWGAYTLGFPAAITVETDDVTINLNGHELRMDREYYLQQRFFALILLSNKPFEARQGPVDFGRNDICTKNIVIKNGVLGLSSHHGIMGSCIKLVTIENLKIQNFDSHGIQVNGGREMVLENLQIGPQNTNIPVRGRYTHARIGLSRFRYFVEEYGDQKLKFANREESTTVKKLVDRLVEQMDMIYYHVMQGIEFDEDDEQWITAKKTFLNPTGWMDGGTSYGILLNGYGTGVVNIGRRTANTYDITMKNIEIHDIKVKPYEGMWAATGNEDGSVAHGFFFETIDWNKGNVINKENGYYIGDAYTDILFAANRFLRHEFCPLGSLFFLDGLADWAFIDKMSAYDDDIKLELRCGSDIQSHSAKGAIGIRIDGVQDYSMEDVYIHNLVNWGDLGSDECGEYEYIDFATGFGTDKDIQYGFTADNVHGILTDYAKGTMKNIKIEHLKSWYGTTHGIALYKGSEVELDGKFAVNNLIAGAKMSKIESDTIKLPNSSPYVCSVYIGPNSDVDTNPEYTPSITTGDDFSIVSHTIYGYDNCGSHERVGYMDDVIIPEMLEEEEEEEMIMNNNDILVSSLKPRYDYSTAAMLIGLSLFTVIMVIICKSNIFNNIKGENTLKGSKGVNYGSF